MNILKNRPLSLILCIMLGVFSLFADFSISFKLISASVSIAIFALLFVFKDLIKGRTIFIKIILILITITFLLSALWAYLFFPHQYYNKTVDISGRIYNIDDSGYASTVISLKTQTISGKDDSHKLKVYLDKEDANSLREYDIISFKGEISELSSSDNGFDSRSYHITYGYSGFAECTGDIAVLGNDIDYFDSTFKAIGKTVSNTLKKRTDFNTGAFLTALIIGDRSELDGNTKLNFLRTGISHILALSGMHIALLSISLNKLLLLFKVNKKARVIIVSLFAVFYMGLTGFSTSVSRAAIMLIITGALYLTQHKADTITSLLISVAVIIIFSPHAAFDLSLWLSAFATLGVICYSEISSDKTDDAEDSFIKKSLRLLYDASMVSVFAFGATFAICAIKFDNLSIISVISTLLFSFITNILIYSGLLILAIGWLIPFGKPVICLSDFIKISAEYLSDLEWIYTSMDSIVTKSFIAVFSLLFFAYIFFETKKQKLSIILIVALMSCTFISSLADTMIRKYDDGVIYAPLASVDSFLLKSKGNTSLIISGKQSKAKAYDVIDFLNGEKVVYLDNLVISNYTYSSIDFSEAIINNVKTERIHIPSPITDDELDKAEGLSRLLSLYGTDLFFYDSLETLKFGQFKFRGYYNKPYSYGDDVLNVFTVSDDESTYTYISGGKYSDVNADSKMLLTSSKYIIIGNQSRKANEFDMKLGKAETIYCHESCVFSSASYSYYTKKGIPIEFIETPVSIWD